MENSIIEEQSFEVLELFQKISNEARKEKVLPSKLNSLGYWWTRKPLIIGKSAILGSIIKTAKELEDTLHLNSTKRSYENTINQDQFETKSTIHTNQIKILDPFAGSGNLIHEAKKLGFDCQASDYNPVSYLILKSIYEYPTKYGDKLVTDLEKFGKQIIQKTKQDLERFFDSIDTPQAFLWYWCIRCHHCGQRFPLTNNTWLSRKKNIGFKIVPQNDLDFKLSIVTNISEKDAERYTQRGGKAICIKCRNTIDYETITEQIQQRKDLSLGIVKSESKIHPYRVVIQEDIQSFQRASNYLQNIWNELETKGLVPNEQIRPDPRSGLRNFGIIQWTDYFTKRQLLVNLVVLQNIQHVCQQIPDAEYQKAIATYFGLFLCKLVDSNSLGTHWHTGTDGPELTMAFRRTNFVFNAAEPNPFSSVRSNFEAILSSVISGVKFCLEDKHTVSIQLQSVLELDESKKFDIILADPPNLNDIQFAEQSEFFYVWLYRLLGKYYPEIPNSIPTEQDLSDSPGRFGDRNISFSFYEKGIKKSFAKLASVLDDSGIILILYNGYDLKSLSVLLESLKESKLHAVSVHPIHIENITNIMPFSSAEFLGQILVCCRKLSVQKIGFFEDMRVEIENSVKKLLGTMPDTKLTQIPISDIISLAYGIALSYVTQFSEIKTLEKDKKIDFETILSEIEKFIIYEILFKITKKTVNSLGPQMSFYLLARIFYHNKMSKDDAKKLGKVFSLDPKYLTLSGMLKEDQNFMLIQKITQNRLKLIPSEIDSDNLYDQLCCLMNLTKAGELSESSIEHFRIDDLKSLISILLDTKSDQLQIEDSDEDNTFRLSLKFI